MSAVGAVVVSLVAILVIAAVFLVLRTSASPKEQYRRELRGIRRIRNSVRAGDPNATTIDVNRDAFYGAGFHLRG